MAQRAHLLVQPLVRRSVPAAPRALGIRALSTETAPSSAGPDFSGTRVQDGEGSTQPRTNRNRAPPSELPKLLRQLAKFKAEGQKPSARAYMEILSAAKQYGKDRRGNDLAIEITKAALRDAEAGKIDLGAGAFEELLWIAVDYPEILPSVLHYMEKRGYTPTTGGLHALSRAAGSSFEQQLLLVGETMQGNQFPGRHVLNQLIYFACMWGQPRLALQFAQRAESMHSGLNLPTQNWVQILTASADAQYLEGVEAAWNRVVENHAYAPDEGLLLAILAVAGREGRTDIATAALGELANIKVKPQEHHFAPVLEAMCNEGRVPEALRLPGKMRAAGVVPLLRTVQPLVKVLDSEHVVDQAFYELEDMAQNNEPVDVAALNAVIAASVNIGDLQRARATQLAAESLGVKPDVDTFNLVIRACEKAGHRVLGDTVLNELTSAGLKPNAETYEALIHLCLTQVPFEDAFFFLEKMKAQGVTPPRSVYLELAFKCVRTDDKRWRLVVEEAQSLGYNMPPSLDRLAQQREQGVQARNRSFRPRNNGPRGEDGQRTFGRDYASRRRDAPNAEGEGEKTGGDRRKPRQPREQDAE
ncbi:hypothetical protein A1Q1_07700 [Trichosporon asahii var. asahii CBS 2479]|uniref:Pentatricopeptide repeat-containing protein-mitochondrial domain-containing protein n=1 Tax=Trichosporon asahii var. asahii (strain ATCC 90039 / CBS 2479 / JCM 2466 / KCTC 7840 / NBRC 103889/ NCYC 2677 / UAMH 7654) TaxID=1186058 RepID=J4UHN1_TRIAS|nr:hypothetical protein A1Q1_07700 [Trichosporon asahii var. asahii CBS 2479]EJT51105.1 hypothetical protein A1Q1_07700 [Trichosporon asahii var. asahii CBS 2479]